MPHKFARRITFLRKSNRAINAKKLRKESRTTQPHPVPTVACNFMIDQPLLKYLGATFPMDVASPAREEAGDGMTTEMVDPSLQPQLPHEGVDPGEACDSELPAAEICLCFLIIDDVISCQEVVFIEVRPKMPIHEFANRIADFLGEGRTDGGLGTEIHVPK